LNPRSSVPQTDALTKLGHVPPNSSTPTRVAHPAPAASTPGRAKVAGMAKTPELGAPAPDFTLDGVQVTAGEAVRAQYSLFARQPAGPLVLAFYPGDGTPMCTRQLCSYTSGFESFEGLGAAVWGISPQDVGSHDRFARKHNLKMPLLADTGLAVSRLYGITLGGAGLRRSVFVLDSAGILRWKHVSLVGLTFPGTKTIASQLAALAAA